MGQAMRKDGGDRYGLSNPKLEAMPADKLFRHTHFSHEQVMSLHAKFLDVSPSGVVKRDQFTELITPLMLKDVMHEMQELSERYFDLFDVNGDGELSFAELLCGFSLFGHGSPSDKVESCFRLFDHSNSGFISRDELTSLVVTHIRLSRRRPKYVDNPTSEYPRKVPVPGEFELPERSEVEAELKRTMEALFFEVDHNRNSKISLDEFRRAVLSNADAQGYLVNLISVPDANEALSYASSHKKKESSMSNGSHSLSISVSSPAARASHSHSLPQQSVSGQSVGGGQSVAGGTSSSISSASPPSRHTRSASSFSRTSSRSSISLSSDGDFLRPSASASASASGRKRSGSYFSRHVRRNSRSVSKDSSSYKRHIWEAAPFLPSSSSESQNGEKRDKKSTKENSKSSKSEKPDKKSTKESSSKAAARVRGPPEGKEFETPDELAPKSPPQRNSVKSAAVSSHGHGHARKKSGGGGGLLQKITGGLHSINSSVSSPTPKHAKSRTPTPASASAFSPLPRASAPVRASRPRKDFSSTQGI